MNTRRQQLHDIIDIVEQNELEVLYHVLVKFIPEDAPFPDEIESIEIGRREIKNGEYVNHNDINWN